MDVFFFLIFFVQKSEQQGPYGLLKTHYLLSHLDGNSPLYSNLDWHYVLLGVSNHLKKQTKTLTGL